MSEDEQMAAIGKMATDRAAAKREAAIRENQIEEFGKTLYSVALALRSAHDLLATGATQKTIDALIEKGGLDHLKEMILEYQELQSKIAALNKRLAAAGIQ
jgi:hypothetical protein